MRNTTSSSAPRLRLAAALLLSLPSLVAAACFAHGHGALPSGAFLVALFTCIAVGASAGLAVLRHVKSTSPTAAARRIAAAQS